MIYMATDTEIYSIEMYVDIYTYLIGSVPLENPN